MASNLRVRLALLACLLLAGCTAPPIEMEVADHGDRRLVTLFYRGWFGTRSGETPCVREIYISNFNAQGQPEEVWRATAFDQAECPRLASFTVGQAPPGFAETLNRLPAELRGRYRLEVHGIGRGSYDVVY